MTDDNTPKQTAQIIPFGKYKGQPVEVLAQDQQYTDWLMAQDWFRDRYQNFYTIIVNNFQAPTETPEHNAMQVEFLDMDFCRRFIEEMVYTPDQLLDGMGAYLRSLRNYFQQELQRWIESRRKEEKKLERKEYLYGNEEEWIGKCNKNIESIQCSIGAIDGWLSDLSSPKVPIPSPAIELTVEHEGWDVRLTAEWYWEWEKQAHPSESRLITPFFSREFSVFIELKPKLSDDYPAVFRQIKARKTGSGRGGVVMILLIGDYTGQGASLEQVRQFFAVGDIRLLLRHEIYKLPF